MNHHVLQLKKPVTVANSTVTELKLRNEIVGGDLRGISLLKLTTELLTEDLLKLSGRLSGQTDAVMNALHFVDIVALTGVVGGFLNGGPETGTTASPQ